MSAQAKNKEKFIRKINYKEFRGRCPRDLHDDIVLSFQTIMYDYYKQFGRTFSWRKTENPYAILVSEVMLQQTQTSRVSGKFERFIEVFPDFFSLVQASLGDVLKVWQGLGYNRRAKSLYTIAQKIVAEYDGVLPSSEKALQTFPGIGAATAASICAFAFNMPTVFIETNVRSVFTHCFFCEEQSLVCDKKILPFVERTLDKENPRLWYYALTDFGVALKKVFPGINARSKHYAKQSKFEGSDRQIRGEILRIMIAAKKMRNTDLIAQIGKKRDRVYNIVNQLVAENFLQIKDGFLLLP